MGVVPCHVIDIANKKDTIGSIQRHTKIAIRQSLRCAEIRQEVVQKGLHPAVGFWLSGDEPGYIPQDTKHTGAETDIFPH